MVSDTTRRKLLKSIGVAGSALAVGPQLVSASAIEDRWVCDTSVDGMTMEGMGEVQLVADLREELGYCVVEAEESELPCDPDPHEGKIDYDDVNFDDLARSEDGYDQESLDRLREMAKNGESLAYAPDIAFELGEPAAVEDSGLNAANTVDDGLYDLQWDKQSQRIGQVHEDATGEGARIGVIDDGVLGANPESDASHPDLPNVREDLSVNFTFDGEGPGPLNDDHGTHVAGTAAAASNGEGVVGVAPDAEVVDLRVFSGVGASTSSIVNAIVVGAAPEDQEFEITDGSFFDPETKVVSGADCDVVNLSLGLPTLPVCSFIGLLVLIFFYQVYAGAAQFALDNDCVPVASAGNSSTNLADPTAGGFCAPPLDFEIFGESGFFTLPASVDEFLTVGATGPIGFGWGDARGGRPEEVIPGFEIESTTQTELFPEEPAWYSNYGGNGEVNVTAGGGNIDTDVDNDAVTGNAFYDLVFNTGFATDDGAPQDERLDEYEPSYAWKAGTSFSAPQVAGLVALLKGAAPDASPAEVRSVIEETAVQRPVGKSGQTTAPESFPNVFGDAEGTNVGIDGAVDGDQASNPGSNADTLSAPTYRGSGHVDMKKAVKRITDD